MSHRFILLLAGIAGALLGWSEAHAQAAGFDRYRSILDRNPFGGASTGGVFGVGADAIAPSAESFARSLRLTALIQESDGVSRVGLSDDKAQRTYLLAQGERSEDGIEVVEIRPDREETVLRRGTEVVLLKMESGTSAEISSSASGKTSRGNGFDGRRRFDRSASPAAPISMPQPPQPPSAVPATPVPTATQPTLKGPELDQHLREYNLQAIRQGMPPLPIQLTPEEDALLVREGVLPAQQP